MASSTPKQHFGRFELIRRLGAGGMAEVHLAKEPLVGGVEKILALKVIRLTYARDPSFQKMFEEEAKIAVNLNHPCIVQTFGYGKTEETFYLEMEHVDGIDLLQLMRLQQNTHKPMPRMIAAYIIDQVCKGLDYAHRKVDEYDEPMGIVHRDVSPQNILISFDGAVKLADFGIARAAYTREELGSLKGKYGYMSPEQARGEYVDQRSDIFSAGILLWETITGQALYSCFPIGEALARIRTGEVLRPSEVIGDIPPVLEAIVMRALAPDREDRYQTARDLHRELSSFIFADAVVSGVMDSGRLAAFVSQTQPKKALAREPNQSLRNTTLSTKRAKPKERLNIILIEGNFVGMAVARRLLGAEQVRDLMDRFYAHVKDLLAPCGGILHRHDSQGITCLLGLPSPAEHDAQRGIELAVELLRAQHRIMGDECPPLRMGIGVQRGMAAVTQGSVPGDQHRHLYDLYDVTAQVARRLAERAQPGEILVGGSVYRAVRSLWRFSLLPPVSLPELKQASTEGPAIHHARAYRLLGACTRDGGHGTDFVGRKDELQRVRRVLHEAGVLKSARAVLLIGDTGIGKRTLVNTLLAELESRRHFILRATARASAAPSSFSLLMDLCRHMVGLPMVADASELSAHHNMARALLEQSTSNRQLLAPLATLMQEGNSVEQSTGALASIVYHLSATRTAILVIENLQWADDASLQVITQLYRQWRGRGMAVVFTARMELLSPERQALLHESLRGLLTVKIAPLSPDEAVLLIRSKTQDSSTSTTQDFLQQKIIEKSHGNPWYIHEIVDAMYERGVIGRGADHAVTMSDGYIEIPVPTTIETAISSQLTALPESTRDCLRYISICNGLEVGADFLLLGYLLNKDPDQDIKLLTAKGLLRKNTNHGYAVPNVMIREVACAALSNRDQQWIKEKIWDLATSSSNTMMDLDEMR